MKPTNTGRLIADVLPQHTHAFVWHRTEPDDALLAFLSRRKRTCYLVFPESYSAPANDSASSQRESSPRITTPRAVFDAEAISLSPTPTFILLDGTWKQARKMFHMSTWLQDIPLVRFTMKQSAAYQLRRGAHAEQASTLEAAAGVLDALGDSSAASLMLDYFAVFNEHYSASRDSRLPQSIDASARLLAIKNNA